MLTWALPVENISEYAASALLIQVNHGYLRALSEFCFLIVAIMCFVQVIPISSRAYLVIIDPVSKQ